VTLERWVVVLALRAPTPQDGTSLWSLHGVHYLR